jgi:WD40 repeat protein
MHKHAHVHMHLPTPFCLAVTFGSSQAYLSVGEDGFLKLWDGRLSGDNAVVCVHAHKGYEATSVACSTDHVVATGVCWYSVCLCLCVLLCVRAYTQRIGLACNSEHVVATGMHLSWY